MIIWYIFCWICIISCCLFVQTTSNIQDPCSFQGRIDATSQPIKKINICLLKNNEPSIQYLEKDLSDNSDISFVFIDGEDWTNNTILLTHHCQIQLEIISISLESFISPASSFISTSISHFPYVYDRICTSECSPFRKLTIPFDAFDINKSKKIPSFSLTCSLSIDALFYQKWEKVEVQSFYKSWGLYLLSQTVWLTYLECSEQETLRSIALPETSSARESLSNTPRYFLHRRNIQGLFIWIGNEKHMELMHKQALVLQNEAYHNTSAVLGWAATDGLYPCRSNSVKCEGGLRRYKQLLPQSAINFMGPGWACAQRRPLRSLAHTLSLFNPEYLVLLDDDSFFNYQFFVQSKYYVTLYKQMMQENVYFGEFMGRSGDNGHLTKKGMFVGGSGYILGKGTLNKLMDTMSVTFDGTYDEPDDIRSKLHKQVFSVLEEGKEYYSNNETLLTNSCIHQGKEIIKGQHTPFYYQSLSIRLIDFCTNLMANEHTCQHSDHSLGRCLVYGAGANPIGSLCQKVPSSSSVQDTKDTKESYPWFGMCFQAIECNLQQHLTCHRYVASLNVSNHEIITKRTQPNNRKAYLIYSSSGS